MNMVPRFRGRERQLALSSQPPHSAAHSAANASQHDYDNITIGLLDILFFTLTKA